MAPRKKQKRKSPPPFDVQRFLDSTGATQRVMRYERSATVFSQGDPATSVMYIQHGGIKLSVLSEGGKELFLIDQACLLGDLRRDHHEQISWISRTDSF